jgi:hypothetical protein
MIGFLAVNLEDPPDPADPGHPSGSLKFQTLVTVFALLQYPLHLYSVIALRASNQSLLSGESENEWGFGQIVAVFLVVAILLECGRKWKGKSLLDVPNAH